MGEGENPIRNHQTRTRPVPLMLGSPPLTTSSGLCSIGHSEMFTKPASTTSRRLNKLLPRV